MNVDGGFHSLVFDEDIARRETLVQLLGERGGVAAGVRTEDDLFDRLASDPCDALFLCGDELGGEHGRATKCTLVREQWPQVAVVLVGAFDDPDEAAAEALRAGACDLLLRSELPGELDAALERIRRRPPRGPAVRRLVAPGQNTEPGLPALDTTLIGWGPAMRDIARRVRHAALHDVPVLVTGESGTGKEVVARALHDLGPRRGGPFVAVDCAAVPDTLMESELFGHARGAFTSAVKQRRGLMLQADGGTLFLDEVNSMPMELQPKLLRALEARRVRPVGTDEEIPFDARVVAAMGSDPELEVREGRFREDLLYRLDVLRVDLPPLRHRGQDVLALAEQFLRRYARASGKPACELDEAAAQRLVEHDWPGNVRELRNCIERAVTVCTGDRIRLEDLPLAVRRRRAPSSPDLRSATFSLPTMSALEAAYIDEVLARVGGNKVEAARLLGISRATLYRKLQRLGR